MTETEYKILNWRGDSLNAERMCADILIMLDFESVDPQSPLGGPDGTKDIVCKKGVWQYIAAVYFAPIPKNFNSVKNKFLGDYKGVKKNSVDGIIFLTNQNLTPANKKSLASITEKDKAKCIIYDNEAIRGLLDSGLGLPIRLQHLKIKLSEEDQIAFFSKQQNRMPQLLDFYSKGIISALSTKIDECCRIQEFERQKIDDLHAFAQQTIAYIQETASKSDKSKIYFPINLEISTKNLDSNRLKFIHNVMLFESGSQEIGTFRTHTIWVGSPYSSPEKATYLPPKPELVPELTEELLKEWRENYDQLINFKKKSLKIKQIAKFHSNFLSIHPFLDGNGRVARFLLNQQASELLNITEQVIIEDRPSYFDALSEGQKGNLAPLIAILTIAIYGTDNIE